MWNYDACIEDSKNMAREEGLKEGLKQGIEQGLEQGLEQGIEQGKLSVARNMKKLSVPIEVIMQSTNLSKEEIEKL